VLEFMSPRPNSIHISPINFKQVQKQNNMIVVYICMHVLSLVTSMVLGSKQEYIRCDSHYIGKCHHQRKERLSLTIKYDSCINIFNFHSRVLFLYTDG
jgi:hypothetical protein